MGLVKYDAYEPRIKRLEEQVASLEGMLTAVTNANKEHNTFHQEMQAEIDKIRAEAGLPKRQRSEGT